MTDTDFKAQLKQQLPDLLRQDDEIRGLVLHTVEQYFANRQETESRFDQVLAEMRRDREAQMLKWQEQSRKWEENDRKWEEQNRKWEEQNRKWDENGRRQDEIRADIKAMNLKQESTIGALGARWGLYSEAAFRNGLKAILEDTFGVQVLNVVEYDDAGEVFGRPEQIELDLIIRNGDLILCEIKSSVSKPDLYAFLRKVEFYEKRHQRQATRKMVISPMVHPSAQPIGPRLGMYQRQATRKMVVSPMVHPSAQPIGPRLGIEVYSYAEDVPATPSI